MALRSASRRARTMVLATEMVAPMTKPWIMGHPASQATPRAKRHRKQNAERAAAQGDPLHPHQVGDGKFHADGKHQQDYADFGENFEGVQVGDLHAGSKGADDDAAEDEAEDEREFQPPGEQAAETAARKMIG